METLGNISLLDREKIGYYVSGTTASLSVRPTPDWAAGVAPAVIEAAEKSGVARSKI